MIATCPKCKTNYRFESPMSVTCCGESLNIVDDSSPGSQPSNKISDQDLIEKCSKWVDSLCKTGGKSWSLKVPVDFNNDPDILFTELINRFQSTTANWTLSPETDNKFTVLVRDTESGDDRYFTWDGEKYTEE